MSRLWVSSLWGATHFSFTHVLSTIYTGHGFSAPRCRNIVSTSTLSLYRLTRLSFRAAACALVFYSALSIDDILFSFHQPLLRAPLPVLVKYVSTRTGPELHLPADAQGWLMRDTTVSVLPLGGHPLLCYASDHSLHKLPKVDLTLSHCFATV